MAVAFVVVLHWNQFLSLLKTGSQTADWSISPKSPPLPGAYVIGLLAAIFVLDWIPYLEEMWRCLNAGRYQMRHALAQR